MQPKYCASQSRAGEPGGHKCNQGPEVSVLGLKLNWVMKLAGRGERMMSDANVITLPRVLLATGQAPPPPAPIHQLLRCPFLLSLSFRPCWLGFHRELYPGLSDQEGHFMAGGSFGSLDTTCSDQPLSKPWRLSVLQSLLDFRQAALCAS